MAQRVLPPLNAARAPAHRSRAAPGNWLCFVILILPAGWLGGAAPLQARRRLVRRTLVAYAHHRGPPVRRSSDGAGLGARFTSWLGRGWRRAAQSCADERPFS